MAGNRKGQDDCIGGEETPFRQRGTTLEKRLASMFKEKLMFKLLISADATAWETAQSMRMPAEWFKENSGDEAAEISLVQAQTLKVIEDVPALLMYEWGVKA